eukprot:scaffold306813_cov38-Prasinocladus_malaysianus.AAC.1
MENCEAGDRGFLGTAIAQGIGVAKLFEFVKLTFTGQTAKYRSVPPGPACYGRQPGGALLHIKYSGHGAYRTAQVQLHRARTQPKQPRSSSQLRRSLTVLGGAPDYHQQDSCINLRALGKVAIKIGFADPESHPILSQLAESAESKAGGMPALISDQQLLKRLIEETGLCAEE